MRLFETVIQEGDVADDAQPVGKDGEFVRIAEMAVNILLFLSLIHILGLPASSVGVIRAYHSSSSY